MAMREVKALTLALAEAIVGANQLRKLNQTRGMNQVSGTNHVICCQYPSQPASPFMPPHRLVAVTCKQFTVNQSVSVAH